MATIPNRRRRSFLPSPHACKGVPHDQHKQYHGKPDPRMLNVQKPAGLETMNPSIDPEFLANSPTSPRLCECRFGCNTPYRRRRFHCSRGRRCVTSEGLRPFIHGKRYYAFAKPAGGSEGQLYACRLAMWRIAFRRWMLCGSSNPPPPRVRDRNNPCPCPPSNTASARATADRFAAEFAVEAFREHTITLETPRSNPNRKSIQKSPADQFEDLRSPSSMRDCAAN